MTADLMTSSVWKTNSGSNRAEIVTVDVFGFYSKLSVLAPHIASSSAAGQFLGVGVGDGLDMILHRYFSIFDVNPETGIVEFVIAIRSRGTEWIARRRPGDKIDVLGPLGRPFPQPQPGATTLVVGSGHGCAALYRLVRDRIDKRDRVHVLLGASTAARLYALDAFGKEAASMRISTEDGSIGAQGSVCDLIEDAVKEYKPDVAYACGSMSMLQIVAEQLASHNVNSYVAIEERMACGIGVCMTCVLPIIGDDGVTRMTRSCFDGPVFRTNCVRWKDIGTVPHDCWGA